MKARNVLRRRWVIGTAYLLASLEWFYVSCVTKNTGLWIASVMLGLFAISRATDPEQKRFRSWDGISSFAVSACLTCLIGIFFVDRLVETSLIVIVVCLLSLFLFHVPWNKLSPFIRPDRPGICIKKDYLYCSMAYAALLILYSVFGVGLQTCNQWLGILVLICGLAILLRMIYLWQWFLVGGKGRYVLIRFGRYQVIDLSHIRSIKSFCGRNIVYFDNGSAFCYYHNICEHNAEFFIELRKYIA